VSNDGPVNPPNWGPPGGPVPPPADPYQTEPLLPWRSQPAAPQPPGAAAPPPRNPYVTAADAFPSGAGNPNPLDPAEVAAAHQAALGEPPAPSRVAGAHRIQRSPLRYVLPALLGALVVVAIGIGLVGWVGNRTTSDTVTATSPGNGSSPAGAVTPPTTAAATASSAASSAAPTRTRTSSPRPTAKASVTAAPRPPVVFAPLVVLNETTERGLAARVAQHLRGLGWTVTGVGNWRGSIAVSTVYYPPGMLAAAQSLAYQLGLTRLRPQVAGMLTDRLTVVLTSDPLV
jgi:LytR cell envelope-related transcriptional attenuator